MDNDLDELIVEEPTSFFHPKKRFYRYFSLIFICLLTFGSEGCYVLPGGLEKEIERDLEITTTEFTLFTSLYSWPNVVLCFLSGYLVDKILGNRLAAIMFLSIITSGQLIFGLGAYFNQTIVMYFGRFIFGLGGESIHVVQKTFASKWFNENELNLVFGLLSSSALLGSCVNQISMTPIYEYVSQFESGYKCLGITIIIASSICVLSLICSFILFPLDKRRDRYGINVQKSEDQVIKLKDVVYLPVQFWLIVLICGIYIASIFPFVSLGKLYFIRKFNQTASLASLLQSLFFLITVVVSPLCGLLVDYTGKNLLWVIGSLVLAIISHILLMFSYVNVFVPVVLLSVSFSIMMTALWPMISVIIPKHQIATAYGLIMSGVNLGLAVSSLASGFIVENNGYFILELYFMSLCIAGLIFTLILYFINQFKV